MTKKRMALIGTGSIANKHAEVLQTEVADAQIIAAVDVREDAVKAFAECYNIPGQYTDADAMLAQEKPDIVIFGEQVKHQLECFDKNERPLTSGEGARRTLEFLASMYKSALTGQTVTRGSIIAGDPFYETMNGQAP